MLHRIKVAHKIFLIVSFVGVLLALLFAMSFLSFSHLRQELDVVKNQGMPNAMVAKDMQMQVVQMQQWLTDISATRGLDDLDDGFQEAAAAKQLFFHDLEVLRRHYQQQHDTQGLQQIAEIEQRLGQWYQTGEKMARAYIAGGPEAGNPIMGEFDQVSTQLQKALEPVINEQMQDAGRDIDKSIADLERIQWWILVGMLSILLVLILGGTLLARGVALPLNHLSHLMTKLIADKDFSVQLEVKGKDEIANVSNCFNQLVVMLREMLQQFTHDIHQLDHMAAELADVITTSSHSAQETSQSASGMAAAVEQMSSNLNQMRQHTEAALQVVDVSSSQSDEGNRVIGNAIEDMQRITTEVFAVSQSIHQLNEQTTQISQIVSVIREVADQTNLLALNAAIEAARAGEQGRGFAVVADEVRKLAERTAGATIEIADMIGAIQSSANVALEKMDVAVNEANTGAELAQHASEFIAAMGKGSHDVANTVHALAKAIAEQTSAGQFIAGQVEHVAQAVEENHLAIQHTAQTVHTLTDLSQDIRQRVAQFSL